MCVGSIRPRYDAIHTVPDPNHVHAATAGAPDDQLRVDVERPIDPNRLGIVSRDQYPPCPHCDEPVITIRTLGPHLHAADPCGCPLDRETVTSMLGGPNR
ncbi:hypothetical protein ACFOUR_13135 [Halovivax cerinus]|uniref:Small CPxCG-related zinc finger protein n=1 Tax=Halovivax cerinus TaxID=1487865 RepID=A0ABD5NQF7_9EURY